jgi:hypothetical protein
MEHMHGYTYINAVFWGFANYLKDTYKDSIRPLSKAAFTQIKVN